MARNPLEGWLEAGDAPLPDDPDDGDTGPARQPRLRWLLAAACIPLLALAWVALRGFHDPAPGPGDREDPTPGAPGGAVEPLPGRDGASLPVGAERPVPPEPAARWVDVPAEVGAVAALSVRLEVSRLSVDDAIPRYVDFAVADGVEHVEGIDVVTVLAVVLEGDAEGWTDTNVRRFAVPVAAAGDGTPVPAGRPWPLPTPDGLPSRNPEAANARLPWTPIDDPPDGIAEALEAAGFSATGEIVVHATEGRPLARATFTAERPAGRHDVWLALGPPPRVLGTGDRAPP